MVGTDGRRAVALALVGCLSLGGVAGYLPTVVLPSVRYALAETADDAQKPTQAPDYAYKLTKVSSFESPSNSLRFENKAAIKVDGEKRYLVGPDGASLVKKDGKDQPIVGAKYVGNNLFVVVTDGENVNSTGLVDIEGNVVIPFEAAIIEAESGVDDPRFLRVSYATDKTTDKKECFVYRTDSGFSLNPTDDDVMYKGYAQIFSVDKKQMLKDVKITQNTYDSFKDLHDACIVKQDGISRMYDATGKELWWGEASSTGKAAVVEHGTSYRIIDTAGKERFSTVDALRCFDTSTEYYTQRNADGTYVVITADGKQVTKDSYDQISSAAGGLFMVGKDQDKIVDASGSTVLKGYKGLKELLPGYCMVNANGEYVLLKSGKKLTSSKSAMNDLVIKTGDNTYLVLNDGKKTIELQSVRQLKNGLVNAQKPGVNSTRGLFDLFTGETLLDAKYEKIEFAGDHIFAFADGTWTTYALEFTQK